MVRSIKCIKYSSDNPVPITIIYNRTGEIFRETLPQEFLAFFFQKRIPQKTDEKICFIKFLSKRT